MKRLLLLGALTIACSADVRGADPAPEPIHAALVGGNLLTPQLGGLAENRYFTSLLIVPLQIDRPSQTLHMSVNVVDFAPVRWHVSHSRIWAIDGTSHVEWVYRYELGEFLKGRAVTPRMEGIGLAGEEKTPNPDLVLRPLFDIRIAGRSCAVKGQQVHCDILPVSRNELVLFALTNIPADPADQAERETPLWSMRAERSTWVFEKNPFEKNTPKEWRQGMFVPVDTFEIAFKEPFQTLAKGEVYYFLTASGKLYRTGPRALWTGRRNIEPVWDDAKRPITHFLTDADADRTFLFCKAAKEGEPGVFFELGPKPEPKPYDLSKVKPSTADEPLKGVLERARFLADQKLLKHAEPPKDEKKP
jgi:hypothetical protein